MRKTEWIENKERFVWLKTEKNREQISDEMLGACKKETEKNEYLYLFIGIGILFLLLLLLVLLFCTFHHQRWTKTKQNINNKHRSRDKETSMYDKWTRKKRRNNTFKAHEENSSIFICIVYLYRGSSTISIIFLLFVSV